MSEMLDLALSMKIRGHLQHENSNVPWHNLTSALGGVREEERRGERRDGKEPEELGDRLDQYLYSSRATDSVRQNSRDGRSADAH